MDLLIHMGLKHGIDFFYYIECPYEERDQCKEKIFDYLRFRNGSSNLKEADEKVINGRYTFIPLDVPTSKNHAKTRQI